MSRPTQPEPITDEPIATAHPRPVRVVAISGSLRARSSNSALLEAAARLAPPGVSVHVTSIIGRLPHFNPDHEEMLGDGTLAGPVVQEYRELLAGADAVIISTPEYAHGVPGALKNALDWVVGTGELVFKPVALFNASARSVYAQAQITETLTVMSASLVSGATITLNVSGGTAGADAIVDDAESASRIVAALNALRNAVHAAHPDSPSTPVHS